MSYKTDRWAGQLWVEYYPPNGFYLHPPEFPVFNNKKYTNPQELMDEVKLQSVSGLMVKEWITRSRLTDLYYGVNAFLILFVIILLLKFRSGRNRKYNGQSNGK